MFLSLTFRISVVFYSTTRDLSVFKKYFFSILSLRLCSSVSLSSVFRLCSSVISILSLPSVFLRYLYPQTSVCVPPLYLSSDFRLCSSVISILRLPSVILRYIDPQTSVCVPPLYLSSDFRLCSSVISILRLPSVFLRISILRLPSVFLRYLYS